MRSTASRRVVHNLWLGDMMSAAHTVLRFLERSAGPVLDLAVRIWLAQAFFISGVLKIGNWENALLLARVEYPVAWLDPVLAAWLGVTVEMGGSILLALGLGTRFAALVLLALSLVIQFSYRTLDTHLYWAALFGWYFVRGAGPVSLDHLLARGLGDSALPFASLLVHGGAWMRARLAPLYALALRYWLAVAFLIVGVWGALGFMTPETSIARAWLPITSLAPLQAGALALAFALATGLGTRLVAMLAVLYALPITMGTENSQLPWFMMLAGLLAAHGPGAFALDGFIERVLRRAFPQLDGRPAFSLDGLPRVVIVGAGFGGIACARALARTRAQVTLIDRRNYHLFQPLLYQVATAALAPGDIAMPIRSLFRDQFNTRVLMGEVTGVDAANKEVLVVGQRLPFDYLVLASGASHSYFGRDDWEPDAPGLKRVEDATDVRRRLLTAFEKAEAADDEMERRALLSFVIVGGGPTGVELAGAIAELAHFGMEKEFRRFDPANARIILVQSAPRLLPTFPEALSARTRAALEKLGVEVRTGSRVEHIDDGGVRVSGERIAARTVFWAAGVVASPAAKWLNAKADNAGRVEVGADLSVPDMPEVFVVGDTALSKAWKGNPVPGLAPAAKQGGGYVARVIRARIEGRTPPAPFRYLHPGSLATIGRKAAVADFGFVRLSGALAWWLWGVVHVYFLVGARNRVSVMFDWFWSYLTFRAGTRLITGNEVRAPSTVPAPIRQEISHA